jgi:hypothetical protein
MIKSILENPVARMAKWLIYLKAQVIRKLPWA